MNGANETENLKNRSVCPGYFRLPVYGFDECRTFGNLSPSPSPSTNKKVVFLKKSKEGWEDISVLFLCLVVVAFFPRSPLFIQKGCFFHFFLMFSKMKQKGWDAFCLFFLFSYIFTLVYCICYKILMFGSIATSINDV